jgi:DNA-binding transcriptional MerR regulator
MPRKPPAPQGVTAYDLALQTGVSRDTIFTWTGRGLLPPVAFHGTHTRYGATHQLRAGLIAKLRKEGVPYADITRALAVSDDELIRRAAPPPPPPPPPSPVAAPVAASDHGPTWQHVELLPGLELHVASAASAFVRRIADEVIARYRASASDPPSASSHAGLVPAGDANTPPK